MATHFYYNGHTYEIEAAPLGWTDAAVNAASLTWDDKGSMGVTVSAYLAMIGSEAENAAIFKGLKGALGKGMSTAFDGGGGDYAWLGGTDEETEGAWQWIDMSAMAGGFQKWGSGPAGAEPDDFGSDQDYLAMGVTRWPAGGGIGEPGEWNDLSGANLLWSIIEWDGLIGTTGNDKLTGTAGADVIDGKEGDDNIKGGEGDDTIYAGDGNDKVDAGNGNNSVIAETTNVHDDDGNDVIKSGSGDDFIATGTGDDQIKAGDGDNLVLGADGNDIITTGAGNDTIDIDGIYVVAGTASNGNDTIKTGAGNDFIVLGEGADKVWGGTGSDTFAFSWLPDGLDSTNVVENGVVVTKVNIHRINDFDAGSSGGSVDFLAFDSLVFESLEGFAATNFAKGKGLSVATSNETGIDDYLLFDTGSGKLYYDADGNGAESSAVLIAIVKGKTTDLNFEDITIL